MDSRRSGLDRRLVSRGGRREGDRPGRYPTVLIADSYDGARRPCVKYLNHFNFEVIEAAHGDEALAKIVARPPRLIVAEWSLPAMPALRLAQWLTHSWRTADIPVIAVNSADVLQTARAGVAGFLMKPFPLRTMLEEVRRVLRETAGRSWPQPD